MNDVFRRYSAVWAGVDLSVGFRASGTLSEVGATAQVMAHADTRISIPHRYYRDARKSFSAPPMIEELGIAAFAVFFIVAGFAMLAKQQALITFLRLRTASRSPVSAWASLALGAFAIAVLFLRLSK